MNHDHNTNFNLLTILLIKIIYTVVKIMILHYELIKIMNSQH